MDKNLIAYCAGFFDGEGTVNIARPARPKGKQRTRPWVVQVHITSTDREICELFVRLFGGKVYICNYAPTNDRLRQNHTVYRWAIAARKATDWLRTMMPYLRLKKPQARLTIALQNHINQAKHTRWNIPNPKSIAYRESIRQQVCDLNHKRIRP